MHSCEYCKFVNNNLESTCINDIQTKFLLYLSPKKYLRVTCKKNKKKSQLRFFSSKICQKKKLGSNLKKIVSDQAKVKCGSGHFFFVDFQISLRLIDLVWKFVFGFFLNSSIKFICKDNPLSILVWNFISHLIPMWKVNKSRLI